MRAGRLLRAILAGTLAAAISGCGFSEILAGSEDGAYETGRAFIENREYRDAVTSLETAIAQGEDGAEVYRAMGLARFNLGEYSAAEEAFKTALSKCGGVPDDMAYDIAYYYAETLTREGRDDEAVSVYDAILKLRPDESDARYLRGLCYLRDGDHADASEDFQAVYQATPRQYDRIFSIYDALGDAGYGPEADGMLKEIMTVSGDSMSGYEKGRCYYYLGDLENAKSCLEEAMNDSADKRAAEKIPIVILLGQVAQELSDDSYAISIYRRFLQDDQSEAEIYNALGVCEIRMGSYSDALSDLQIGLALDDAEQNASILRNMAAVCEYIGNFEMAYQRLSEYLELVPTDEDARRESVFLSTRLAEVGDPEIDNAEGVVDADVIE